MGSTFRNAQHALRNAFRSPGCKLFGLRFSRDYLRFAWHAARRWGSTEPGTLAMLGARIDYFNQNSASFLLHEIYVNTAYRFSSDNPRPRILDCGANIGMAAAFFKALYPQSRIAAFEPEPTTFARLKQTVERNRFRDVELHNAALSEKAGTITLYKDADTQGSPRASVEASWGGGASVQVPALRLSGFAHEPIDFLKLDIEGAEYGVLRDLVATGTIRNIREAVIEYHQIASERSGLEPLGELLTAGGHAVRAVQQHTELRAGAGAGVGGRSASEVESPRSKVQGLKAAGLLIPDSGACDGLSPRTLPTRHTSDGPTR